MIPYYFELSDHFQNKNLSTSISYITEPYLSKKYTLTTENENIFINSRFFPNERLIDFIIKNLIAGEALFHEKKLVIAKCTLEQYQSASYYVKDNNESLFSTELKTITDLFTKNEIALAQDFELITKGRKSAPISSSNTVIGNNIFLEEGAKVEASILNSTTGPIYIGKDAEIMEGCLVRGSLALCEHSVLKMGAKIYGATTIGKYSKVGGEVNNAVIQDYSNKGHDGFLGNSIIGEWCNLGADTNTSNLKNNYAEVKIWSYEKNKFEQTGLQFCGLIMGDHSKCGINTMFNTGTVVGVAANIFGSGFPRNFVPSFSWGGTTGFTTYQLDKVFEVAKIVMERRAIDFNHQEMEILTAIFELTAKSRQ